MLLGIITLLTSLLIAGVAGWFSIAGLMAIFSASAIPIAIMAGSLEIGKLVTTSWLYRNWKETGFLLKSYLTGAVIVLMFITSMGIFGYLSKAHIEQSAGAGDNTLQIELLDNQITRQQRRIDDNDSVIGQLDEAVQILMDYDRIRGDDGAIAVRQSQADERALLNTNIDEAGSRIFELQQDRVVLSSAQLSIEAEVGPLRYIAELIYGEAEARDHFDEAVRWIIIILIFVFDPLAVGMLLAANQSFRGKDEDPEPKLPEQIGPTPPMPDVPPAKKEPELTLEEALEGTTPADYTKPIEEPKKKDEEKHTPPPIVEEAVEKEVPKVKTAREKLGFWANPIPKNGEASQTDTKKYLGKK